MNAGAWQALGLLAGVVIAIITAAGAVLAARGPRKASPYEALERRVVWLEEQHHKSTQVIDDQQTEIAGLKRRMLGVINDRDDIVRYVVIFREWVANGARPPAPDIPAHLADVIPAWVPGDGAEPPMRRPRPIDYTD